VLHQPIGGWVRTRKLPLATRPGRQVGSQGGCATIDPLGKEQHACQEDRNQRADDCAVVSNQSSRPIREPDGDAAGPFALGVGEKARVQPQPQQRGNEGARVIGDNIGDRVAGGLLQVGIPEPVRGELHEFPERADADRQQHAEGGHQVDRDPFAEGVAIAQ
jgi:hypothetical protein